MTAERRKLLLLFASGIALYFFTNLQRTGVPGSLFNELQRDLALSASQVAMLGTFFVYIYTFNQLVAGVLTDRYGGTRTMLFGSFFFCVGSLLFPLAGSLWTAYAARALVGFGASFMYLSMVKLAQRLFPAIFPQMVGMTLLLGYLGSITANAPLVSLANAVGWRSALLLAGMITAVLLGVFMLVWRKEPFISKQPAVYLQAAFYFASAMLYFFAVERMNAGITTVLFYLYPAMVAAIRKELAPLSAIRLALMNMNNPTMISSNAGSR